MMLSFVILSALVAFVSAQASDSCKSTLASIALHPEAAACLNTAALISVVTGDSSTSLVPTINSWLSGVCSSPACSDATLTAVVTNLTTGCADETGALGLGDVESSVALVTKYYPTVRKIICLKDGSDNCVTKTLQAAEAKIGALSLDGLVEKISNGSLAEITPDVYCTDCTKAAWNIVLEDVPEVANNTQLKDQADATCGAGFSNGEKPANIVSTENAESEEQGSASSLKTGLSLAVAGAAFFSLL